MTPTLIAVAAWKAYGKAQEAPRPRFSWRVYKLAGGPSRYIGRRYESV